MSGYRNSAGVDFDNLFDPDTQGDGYVATFLRDSNGSGLHYAAAKYGTPGPVVGFRDSGGNDVGPQWAAKGTAQYSLPINGQTFLASSSSGTGNSSASIAFNAATSGWSVSGTSSSGGTVNTASGSLPSGATKVQYSYTLTDSSGAGSVTNQASAVTALGSANVSINVVATSTPSSGDNHRYITVTIVFYNSSSQAISTTTIYLNATATGAA